MLLHHLVTDKTEYTDAKSHLRYYLSMPYEVITVVRILQIKDNYNLIWELWYSHGCRWTSGLNQCHALLKLQE